MKSLNKNPETPPKLKRFLAFAGDDYYPRGGFKDFFDSFSSLEEAKKSITQEQNCRFGDEWKLLVWAQIFDTETQKIVWTERDN